MTLPPLEACPDVELDKLPHIGVTTYDGHKLQLGSIVYYRFAAGRSGQQCVVVSDRAVRRKDGHDVFVVGSRGRAVTMDPQDLVHDVEIWWNFWCKRYGSAADRSNGNGKSRQIG